MMLLLLLLHALGIANDTVVSYINTTLSTVEEQVRAWATLTPPSQRLWF